MCDAKKRQMNEEQQLSKSKIVKRMRISDESSQESSSLDTSEENDFNPKPVDGIYHFYYKYLIYPNRVFSSFEVSKEAFQAAKATATAMCTIASYTYFSNGFDYTFYFNK